MKIKYFITNLFKFSPLEKLLTLPLIQNSGLNYWIVRKIVPRRFQYPPQSFRFVRRNNIWFKLDISQHIEYSIFYNSIEDSSRKKLYSLLKTGFTVLDIGTNIGEVLLNIASKIGPAGKIYGFEPNPPIFERLLTNISLNNFKNISVFKLGLSHENKDFQLYEILPENLGATRILDKDDGISSKTTIHTIKVDDFVTENNITKIDLIKIDVEGFELFVLMGASEVLKKWKPVLFIELIDSHQKIHHFGARQLVEYLISFGYRCYRADNNQFIDDKYELKDCVFDIYCI